jgi:hypothetical protein
VSASIEIGVSVNLKHKRFFSGVDWVETCRMGLNIIIYEYVL